ncbi:HTH-type transcriptional regulator HdfR [Pseudomonas sp. MM223]|nr:HTH-type transcriptional regulator HdfR [Pseudomonas sp. MM223]
MTLTELRYIVTLAQEQHFGHAAERCHVSQPTLSVGVKKLEDELGVLIFERSKSAVRLTPVGESIVAQAQKVLEQAQGIRELAQAGKNQLTAPLKVGAIYTVGPYLFPHLIPQLHRVAPQMPLYIEENFTHVLREKLRNGELDAVIIALPFNEADVLTLPLYDEPFCALMPADHPWTAKKTIDTAMLNDKSLLLLGEGHCFRDQVLEACPTLNKGGEGARHTTVESSLAGNHPPHGGLGPWRVDPAAVGSAQPSLCPWRHRGSPTDCTGTFPYRGHRLARQLPAAEGHRDPRRFDPPVLGRQSPCGTTGLSHE